MWTIMVMSYREKKITSKLFLLTDHVLCLYWRVSPKIVYIWLKALIKLTRVESSGHKMGSFPGMRLTVLEVRLNQDINIRPAAQIIFLHFSPTLSYDSLDNRALYIHLGPLQKIEKQTTRLQRGVWTRWRICCLQLHVCQILHLWCY